MSTSELIGLINSAALQYGIDPNIAVAQLDRESVHFSPHYVYGPGRSPAGAQGLAQFMPGTWTQYGNGSPYDPVAALQAWGRYMSHLLSIFGGRYDLALAGYNWGENRAALRQALSTGQSVLSHSIPSETRKYVQAILNAAPGAGPAAVVVDTSFDNFFGLPLDQGNGVASDQLFSLNSFSPDEVDLSESGISTGTLIGVAMGVLVLVWIVS